MESFIHFKQGKIDRASNDGMELLGRFLMGQVGCDNDFFISWLEDKKDGYVSPGAYYLEKTGDQVHLSQMEDKLLKPFETDRKHMIEIIKKWLSCAKNRSIDVGNCGSLELIIERLPDKTFKFEIRK